MNVSRRDCESMDREDPLAHARARFRIPSSIVYLDGNSLGALPAATSARLVKIIEKEWGDDLITSWNAHDWIAFPAQLGRRIAPLIGAAEDEVVVADSTSVNLFKLAAAAINLQAPRTVMLSERGNFPTDLYVLQGLQHLLRERVQLRLVERGEIESALTNDVALLALTHVNYKTGALHDLRALTQKARAVGALTLWDLSHSAGAMELFLDRDDADFAVGCGYKYLNGGPGAPSFLYAARRHHNSLHQPLSGWMGHASPFAFVDQFQPAFGMQRFLCGTPGVLGMAALSEGISTFDGIAMRDVRAKSRELGDLFLTLVAQMCAHSCFSIACPADSGARGSQVALSHAEGYAIVQALISRGVVGDFRDPDILRFGFAPLYTRFIDVWNAVAILTSVMRDRPWKDGRFDRRTLVT